MTAFLEAFAKVVQLFKDNCRAAILASCLVLLAGGGYVTIQILTSINNHFPDASIENKRFISGIKTDQLILKALDDARVQVGADRVVINQFHNNQIDIAGLPFMKSSVTYKAMGPDVPWDPELGADIPISTWNDLFQRMYGGDVFKPKCVGLDQKEVTDSNLRSRFKKAGVEYFVACPILSLAGGTIGMVSVGWLDREHKVVDNDKVFQIIGPLGERVGGYLQADLDKPKTVWDHFKFWEGNKNEAAHK